VPKYAAKPEDLRSCYWISECGPECRICGILENVVSTGVGISVDITESEDIRFGPLYWGFTFSSTSCGLFFWGFMFNSTSHLGPYILRLYIQLHLMWALNWDFMFSSTSRRPLCWAFTFSSSSCGLLFGALCSAPPHAGPYYRALPPHAGPYFGGFTTSCRPIFRGLNQTPVGP